MHVVFTLAYLSSWVVSSASRCRATVRLDVSRWKELYGAYFVTRIRKLNPFLRRLQQLILGHGKMHAFPSSHSVIADQTILRLIHPKMPLDNKKCGGDYRVVGRILKNRLRIGISRTSNSNNNCLSSAHHTTVGPSYRGFDNYP